jgi:hypothetical protein
MLNRLVLKIAVAIGLFGLITSRREVLEWIAPMSSLNAIILYHIILATFLTVLGYWVFSTRWTPKYTLAVILIDWALGIVLYFPVSSYSTGITGAHLTGVEAATEDYCTMNALASIGIHDSTGIITYAIIPAVLILIAGIIVAPSLFSRMFKSILGRTQ